MTTSLNTSTFLDTVGVAPKKMFHGIYLASVVNNNDPLGQGRVTLKVPQVLGTATSNWAVPLGFTLTSVPATGTMVHAYFTGGDVNHPIYIFTGGIQTEISAAVSSAIAALQPGSWIAMTLFNSWVNTAGMIPAQYRINGGSVEVIGNISSGSAGNSYTVAELNTGYYNTSHGHQFPLTVISGASSVQVTGTTDPGFVADQYVSTGILPLSEEYLVPTSNHVISSTPFTLGPSGTQWQSWDQNSEIIDLSTGGQQYLVDTAITSQNAYVDIDYDSPYMSITDSGVLTMYNVPASATGLSFHELIPLDA